MAELILLPRGPGVGGSKGGPFPPWSRGSKGAEGPLGTESHDPDAPKERRTGRATECSVGIQKGALQWQS